MNLQEVIQYLSENYMQIKITTGCSDTINGYGWHAKYSVEVFETIEYCEICKAKKNTNHSDDAHRGNHRWRYEMACIYSNVHYEIDSIVMQLNIIADDI